MVPTRYKHTLYIYIMGTDWSQGADSSLLVWLCCHLILPAWGFQLKPICPRGADGASNGGKYGCWLSGLVSSSFPACSGHIQSYPYYYLLFVFQLPCGDQGTPCAQTANKEMVLASASKRMLSLWQMELNLNCTKYIITCRAHCAILHRVEKCEISHSSGS